LIATSFNKLAGLLQAQGDLARARPLLERALAIRERALGPKHPDTKASLASLAALGLPTGDPVAALAPDRGGDPMRRGWGECSVDH
jgi:hypothetical protein